MDPPTALISEPDLPSEETNRLRPAFLAVKRRFLDRPGQPRSVREGSFETARTIRAMWSERLDIPPLHLDCRDINDEMRP
ncbi:hypothetical protein AVEN_19916-1, partial [Araneus ventricosus]